MNKIRRFIAYTQHVAEEHQSLRTSLNRQPDDVARDGFNFPSGSRVL
jgi:hypothetical protein